jgi:hypothetical protein
MVRLLLLSSVALVIAACAAGDSVEDPNDDGTVITGVGGGSTATSSSSVSSSAVSSSSGVGGSGGSSSTSGTGAGGDVPACPDLGVGEPNESENNAFPLKASAISDCDGDGGMVTGTIAGQNDIDWFTYEGDDTFGCVVDPTRSFTQSESGLRLCKFFECFSGNTEFSCPSGTTAATSPGSRPGCCGTAGFDVTNLNCTGTTDEHVQVYLRVDRPGATAATCNHYSLSYHY